jgi:hypothetical protein
MFCNGSHDAGKAFPSLAKEGNASLQTFGQTIRSESRYKKNPLRNTAGDFVLRGSAD